MNNSQKDSTQRSTPTSNLLYKKRGPSAKGAAIERRDQRRHREEERERRNADAREKARRIEAGEVSLSGYTYNYITKTKRRRDGVKPEFIFFTEKVEGCWVSAVRIEDLSDYQEPAYVRVATHRLRREAKARAYALTHGWNMALGEDW